MTISRAKARKDNEFANADAEKWFTFRRLVEERKIILPVDEELLKQLSLRRLQYDAKARIQLEPKQSLKARGCPSPDKADACIGAVVLSVPGYSGGLTHRDLAGIQFGGGQQLFSGEAVRFNEEAGFSDGVWDISRIARYPFNMR